MRYGLAGAGALLLAASALVACAPVQDDASPLPFASPSPTPSATVPSLPATADARALIYSDDETLLGELPDTRGSAQVGPFENPTGRVALYVRCIGEGEVVIEIVGAATLTQACHADPDDLGSRNTLDVWATDDIVVKGSAENADRWTMAVTAIP